MLRLLATAALALPCSMLPAQGWVDRTPTNPLQTPSPRAFPAMCWDAAHGYVLLFGGAIYYGVGSPNETWSWNGTTWTRHLTTAQPIFSYTSDLPQRTAMAFHAPSNQVVMFSDGATYVWTGADWLYVPSGLPQTPYPFQGACANVAMAYDPLLQQTVMFVGTRQVSAGGTYYASQTFLWNGFAWSYLPTPNLPWPADRPTMAFDPAAGRLVLGTHGTSTPGFFEWTGSNWHQRLPANAPSAPGSFATDTANQRVVMFDAVMNGLPNHTWTIAGTNVQNVATPLEPARRVGAAMAYDPVRQRTVLFGGASVWYVAPSVTTILTIGDTWEFQLPPGASFTTYGAGCLGSRGVPTIAPSFGSLPRVGQTFSVAVTNLALQAWTFMFLGTSDTSYGPLTLPLSLGFIGAPGCSLLASGDDLGLVTNVLGTGLWQWPVPNAPGFSFYTQAFSFDAPANPLGITTSNAGHGVIGF